jgi:hypothetical protein
MRVLYYTLFNVHRLTEVTMKHSNILIWCDEEA